MATARLSVTLRVRDMARMRLFVWELQMLRDEMVVMASPHAEKLDRLIDRLVNGGDDEGMEDTDD